MFRLAVVLFCCAAAFSQVTSIPPEVKLRIEKQVRQYAEAPPDAQLVIGEIRNSAAFTGYYELPITIRGDQGDRSYTFLLAHDFSRLVYPKTFDLSQEPFAAAMKKIDIAGRPVRGNPQAPVEIVMYDDLQCPFCARLYIELFNEVMNHYRDRVKVVMKDFPLTDLHPWAMDAAITADCLLQQREEAYWKFADYVHTHQQVVTAAWNADHATALRRIAETQAAPAAPDALKSCVESGAPKAVIEKSLAEGRSLGVSATPALFINGEFFEGVLPPEQLRAAIERALREASNKR